MIRRHGTQPLLFAAILMTGSAVLFSVWQGTRIRRNSHTISLLSAQITHGNAALALDAESSRRTSAPQRSAVAASVPSANPGSAALLTQTIRSFLGRVEALKQWFAANPSARIPELRYLPEHAWLEQTASMDEVSHRDMRSVASQLRLLAMQDFVDQQLKPALKKYEASHGNLLPTNLAELDPLLPDPAARGILDRYEVLVTGPADTEAARQIAIAIKSDAVRDPDYDAFFNVDSSGRSGARIFGDQDTAHVFQYLATVHAEAAYANSHGGKLVTDIRILLPYFNDPGYAQQALKEQEAFEEKREQRSAAKEPE